MTYNIGDRLQNKQGEWFTIISKQNKKIQIQFDDCDIIKTISPSSLTQRNILHPLSPHKHGDRHTRLYRIWLAMKARCSESNSSKSAKNYYLKGIRVCDEWNTYINFKEWALSHGYNDTLTIDRIDSNKNYCAENCRWITRSENSKMASRESKSHKVVRVDLNNNITIFNSVTEASKTLTTIGRKGLVYRLNATNNFCEGYYWYYENDYEVMKDEYKPTI